MKRSRLFWLIALMGCICLTVNAAEVQTQRKQLFNRGWKFSLGDTPDAASAHYDDSQWRPVELPHDWSVEGSVHPDNPMGNDGGYYPAGIGWYRKTFTLPAHQAGKRFSLYFEGVYMNSEVFVNGKSVGVRPYGYSSFCYDITDFLQPGTENTVAVRVDNSMQKNCRWYTGSGIYRHVWLITHDALHLAHWGTHITTPVVDSKQAQVKMEVAVKNQSDQSRSFNLSAALKWKGADVGKTEKHILLSPQETTVATLLVDVDNPQLWSPDSPSLYTALLAIEEDGRQTDVVCQTFGIRTISYNAEDGLRLNGQPILLNGGCVHHDNGILGAKSFDAAEARKVRLMKEAGFNAVRTAHNVPSEAFLDECDRQGLLVIDESFDGWRDEKQPHDYHKYIDRWWKADVEAMVLRDRNHPSIFCWSIGNEVIERKKLEVLTTARKLANHIRQFDSTRPITSALAAWDRDWEIYDPLAEIHDIVGYNYMIHKSEGDHKRVPDRIMMQTESYPRDAFQNWVKVNDNPYIIGDFVWTAVDYLGESGIGRFFYKGETEGEHYQRNQYPWHGAYCGDIDLTGWRKPISHYRDLLYNADKKFYMAVREPNGYNGEIKETQWSVWPTWESWNWPGHEGKNIEVEIYTRYPRVQLYLNDRPVGEQTITRAEQFKALFAIPYQPGTLRAVALNEQGEPQETLLMSTAATPSAIRLTVDKQTLKADGQDLIYLIAEVVDEKGNVVPIADNRLQFSIQGAGTIEATGSADLKDTESYSETSRKVWKGRAMAVIRSLHKPGRITVKVTSPGLRSETIRLISKN